MEHEELVIRIPTENKHSIVKASLRTKSGSISDFMVESALREAEKINKQAIKKTDDIDDFKQECEKAKRGGVYSYLDAGKYFCSVYSETLKRVTHHYEYFNQVAPLSELILSFMDLHFKEFLDLIPRKRKKVFARGVEDFLLQKEAA